MWGCRLDRHGGQAFQDTMAAKYCSRNNLQQPSKGVDLVLECCNRFIATERII